MSLSQFKASTKDATNGTPVAVAANEDGSDALQAMVAVGNKSTYTEFSRTGLTGADAPTGGNMTTSGFAGSSGANLGDLSNALSAHVRATCGTASATLTGRLALYDGSNNCLGLSELISFTSDATRRLGNATGDFIAPRTLVDVGSARKARFFVESVSAGTWAIYVQPT